MVKGLVMMQLCPFLMLSFTLVSTMSSKAETMPLKEFIAHLSRQHPEAQSLLHEQRQIPWQKTSQLDASRFHITAAKSFGILSQDGSHRNSWITTLSQKNPEDGRSYSLEFKHTHLGNKPERKATLEMEQDLLQIWRHDLYQEKAAMLDVEQTITHLDLLERFEDLVYRFTFQYLEWQLAYLNLRAAEHQSEHFSQILQDVEDRYAQNVADKIDLQKAQLEMLKRKEAVLRQQGKYQEFTTVIQTLLGEQRGNTPSLKIEDSIIKPANAKEPSSAAFNQLRQIRIQRLREQVASHQIVLTREEDRPELAFTLGYQLKDISSITRSQDDDQAYVGLKWQVTLGDESQEAKLRLALLHRGQLELQRLTLIQERRGKLQKLLEDIKTEQAMSQLQWDKWQLAQKIVAQELQRFERGEVELQRLIDAETTVVSSQYAYLQHKVILSQKTYQWLQMTDKLVEALPL